jgi:hypothetical protein
MSQTRRIFLPGIVLAALIGLTLILPGISSWVNDEPILMEMALRYNRTASDIYGIYLPFTPSPFGLLGTRGARYGPVPAWVDQILLAISHNLLVMASIRAVLFSGLTALALYRLAKTLDLSPWFAAVTMISPWLWLYSRLLWDCTCCVPIAAWLFAAYAAFLRRRGGHWLEVTVACLLLLPTVHLVGIALALPVAAHLLAFHWRAVWSRKWSVGGIAAAFIFLFRPYLVFIFSQTHPSLPPAHSPVLGWFFPLFGGHYLTLGVNGTIPGDGWQEYAPRSLRAIVSIARCITWLALPAVWLGMVLAAGRVVRSFRDRAIDAQAHLCMIAVGVWLAQTILDGFEELYFSPHYHVGTWIVYVFFAWLGVDWLSRMPSLVRAALRAGLVGYIGSILIAMPIIFGTLARHGGGSAETYGTCVGDQIDAVARIQRFSDQSTLDVQFSNWRRYPLEMKVLMELNSPPPGDRPTAHLTVKYRDEFPGDVHLSVDMISAMN